MKDLIDAYPEFVDYAQKTYNGKVYFPYSSETNIINDKCYYNYAPYANNYDNLYHVSSIICHRGFMDQGHYYCLSNVQTKNDD